MKRKLVGLFGLLLLFASATAAADRVFQATEMLPGPGSTATGPQGAAWLRRSPKGIDGRVMVRVDHANLPYSIWWIVFNNPEECAGYNNVPKDPCGFDDLFNPAVGAAVFNASGAISAAAGDGGVINVDLELNAREGSNNGHAPFPLIPGLPDFNGVLNRRNGCGAELHLDVNEHAVFDSDWVTELTQPEGLTHRFAVFPAVDCRKRDDDDDDD